MWEMGKRNFRFEHAVILWGLSSDSSDVKNNNKVINLRIGRHSNGKTPSWCIYFAFCNLQDTSRMTRPEDYNGDLGGYV